MLGAILRDRARFVAMDRRLAQTAIGHVTAPLPRLARERAVVVDRALRRDRQLRRLLATDADDEHAKRGGGERMFQAHGRQLHHRAAQMPNPQGLNLSPACSMPTSVSSLSGLCLPIELPDHQKRDTWALARRAIGGTVSTLTHVGCLFLGMEREAMRRMSSSTHGSSSSIVAQRNSEQPTAEIEVVWSIPPSFPPISSSTWDIPFEPTPLVVDHDDMAASSASLLPLLQRSPSERPTKRMATGTKFRLLPGLRPTVAPSTAASATAATTPATASTSPTAPPPSTGSSPVKRAA